MRYKKLEIDNKHLSILKSYIDELWHNQYDEQFHSIYIKASSFINNLIDECSEYQICSYCEAKKYWDEKFNHICQGCTKTINNSNIELKL